MYDLIGEKSRYFDISYLVMLPPLFHARRGKRDPAFEYALYAARVFFGVVVGVFNDPASVFLVFCRILHRQNKIIDRRNFFV